MAKAQGFIECALILALLIAITIVILSLVCSNPDGICNVVADEYWIAKGY